MIRDLHKTEDTGNQYHSYRTILFFCITIIFFVFIVLISTLTYFYVIDHVQNEFNNSRMQAETTFVSSAILTEYGIESFDSQYDFLLSDRMATFFRAYQNYRSNISDLDLDSLKKELSIGIPGEIELYIINKKGVIDYTTYKRDLKTDFSQYPDFFSSLTNIRLGKEFKTDPWIRDYYSPDIYWKYGYQPTDDQEYILEIGLKNPDYSRMHNHVVSDLRKISEAALNIPDLLYVEMYDKAYRNRTLRIKDEGKDLKTLTGLLGAPELRTIINNTFSSKRSFTIKNTEKNQIISIQYMNLSTSRSVSGSERSYVGILVFSTDSINDTIFHYQIGFILLTVLSLLCGLFIARFLSTSISRPLEMMTEDVRIIASTSLNHSVRKTGIQETEALRSSINSMIISIKDNIEEIEIQGASMRRELYLRNKAELSLAKLNKRLTQLSQITRHDILNQMTSLEGYLEIINESDDPSLTKQYVEKTRGIIYSISMLLNFTLDYERIGQEGSIWQNVGSILDRVKTEFSGKVLIVHTCDTIEILADPLIEKVFYNLIDNSIRHGEKVSEIRVIFEEDQKSGYLIYTDDGSGIPEADKERIFVRGYGKGTGLGMAFIREVLESDNISICENGTEGHGARFKITIPQENYRRSEWGIKIRPENS